ncbi:CPBP family intramembrane metalloprotease [Pseudonocardia yunnanensis]|uniref:CPBP family intramembrane glutamic endopeptidase n=1 Tax=Pseudonocardia yunnanensis TaxID=58107 RepID=A0ABW4ELD2_9PSEU
MRNRRSDLLLFFGGTFAVSWIPWAVALLLGGDTTQGSTRVLFVVGTFGPSLVAGILWALRRRGAPRTNPLRTVHRWLLPALVLGAAPFVVAALIEGSHDPAAAQRLVESMGGPLGFVALFLVAGPLAEEFGWRGYAQPRLRRTLSPIATAGLLGSAWALWHVPLFLLGGTSQARLGLFSWQALLFFLTLVPLSYTAWFVSERLAGGVAAAVALHFAGNAAVSLLPSLSVQATLIAFCVTSTIAIVLSGMTRSQSRTRLPADVEVERAA